MSNENSKDLWEQYSNENELFVNHMDELYDFTILSNKGFFQESVTDFDEMSTLWTKVISNNLASDLFKGLNANGKLTKGIQKFSQTFVSTEETYELFYLKSPGFKFFIDNTNNDIFELIKPDQIAYAKAKKLSKISLATKTLGISLLLGKVRSSKIPFFGKKEPVELYNDPIFNSYMYALGYSDFWK